MGRLTLGKMPRWWTDQEAIEKGPSPREQWTLSLKPDMKGPPHHRWTEWLLPDPLPSQATGVTWQCPLHNNTATSACDSGEMAKCFASILIGSSCQTCEGAFVNLIKKDTSEGDTSPFQKRKGAQGLAQLNWDLDFPGLLIPHPVLLCFDFFFRTCRHFLFYVVKLSVFSFMASMYDFESSSPLREYLKFYLYF